MNDEGQTVRTDLSVVIPVRDDERVLNELFERLYPVLDGLGIGYEAVFVDCGSRDRSVTLLRQQHRLRPDATRVLLLRGKIERRTAILAGCEVSRGGRVVTLGADLQIPLDEILRLLAAMDRGHDYVGGIRRRPQDNKLWHSVFAAINHLHRRLAGGRMTDPGCMLRAYDRKILDAISTSGEAHISIAALADLYAANPTEVEVEHRGRIVGVSGHPLLEMLRFNLDLMTGFSPVLLRICSLVGIGVSLVSFIFVVFLAIGWLLTGLEIEGLFAFFGILFLLAGMILLGIGLLGQYLGCICGERSGRPNGLVRDHLRPRLDSVGRLE